MLVEAHVQLVCRWGNLGRLRTIFTLVSFFLISLIRRRNFATQWLHHYINRNSYKITGMCQSKTKCLVSISKCFSCYRFLHSNAIKAVDSKAFKGLTALKLL